MNFGAYSMFLQYYGRKQALIPTLQRFLPASFDTVISPFLGSGAFEYYLNMTQGKDVAGYDTYGALVDYHNCLCSRPSLLQQAIVASGASKPVSKATYLACCERLRSPRRYTPLQRAVPVFVVHQNSYGGKAGPKDYIMRDRVKDVASMHTVRAEGFSAREGDGFETLRKLRGPARRGTFIFIDPPYLLARNYYGQGAFDHDGLRKLLQQIKTPWMLCLNATKEVRTMYAGFTVHEVAKPTKLKTERGTYEETRSELVITNYPS